MMLVRADLQLYFNAIRKELRTASSEKQQIIEALQSDIEEYLTDFPEATLENIISRFGTPESIAKEPLHALPMDEIRSELDIARFNKKATLIALATVVGVVFAFLIIMTLISLDNSSQHYYELMSVIMQIL